MGPDKTGKNSFLLPHSVGDIPTYIDSFEQAIAFTKSCGFELPPVIWMERDVLDSKGEFAVVTMRAAGVLDLAKSAGQCLKWCHFLAPRFQQDLGCTVWVTIGQLWRNNEPVFDPDWDGLRRWAKRGIQLDDLKGRAGINLHAWLTLDTGEIIELTHLSSLAAFAGEAYAGFAGALVWGRDPGVLDGHRYFPMAVGSEFAESIAEQSVVPLLARDSTELHQMVVAAFLQ